jgi:ATP-dependent helicase HrpB
VRAGKEQRQATMVGGRGLLLPPAVDGHDLVLALRLIETGRQNRSTATIVCPLDEAMLQAIEPQAMTTVNDAELDGDAGRVVSVRKTCYRDLVLRAARGGEVPAERAAALLAPLLAADPWRWLGDDKDLRRFLARAQWLAARMPELQLPPFDDAAVAAAAAGMLAVSGDLRTLRAAAIEPLLTAQLSPLQQQALRRQAPDRIELPTGRAAVVDYAAAAGPTVSARLQEFFGLPSVQALAGGRVPVVLELLAPNHRPVQVTTDLPSFWRSVYPQVRRELARRYPRHSWPEDPLAAAPEARPRRRRP